MSPPHISQVPQAYPTYPVQQQQSPQQFHQQQQYQQPQQYQQSPPGVVPVDPAQNAMLVGQNYRDQCQFHNLCLLTAILIIWTTVVFAQCALGNHERKTEYGMFGIITAVVSSFKLVC